MDATFLKVLHNSLPAEAWDGERYIMAPWMYKQLQQLKPQMTPRSRIRWNTETKTVWLE